MKRFFMILLTDEERPMNRTEILEITESVLKTAGFQLSEKCCARPSCFCLVARKDANLTFIKIPNNLGNISYRDASELKTISSWFTATPLFIGEKTRDKPLEDDTIYSRYDVYAVTLKTLENVACREMHPLVEAGPGGYFVKLDGEAIRNRRQELGLSIGELAELLGISRRTLYGYEKGMAKASVSIAYNLEWVLGIPVVKPINVFDPVTSSSGFLATARRVIVKNRFLHAVLKRLKQCNLKVTPTVKAPFDFIARGQESQLYVLGGVACGEEKNLDQRAKEILSICEIVKAQPVFVSDGNFVPDNIPIIRSEELNRIKQPEDLIIKL
jgi:putative transcriptional regulator